MRIEATCPFGDHPFSYESKGGAHRIYCSDGHRRKALYRRQYAARLKARDLGAERTCGRCKLPKPETDFAGPSAAYCHPCMAGYVREKRAAETPGQTRTRQRKETLARYGLTPETFEAKLAAQEGRCAICRTDNPGSAGWQIDHDHSCCPRAKSSCGKCLRDILCTNCNKAFGMLKENPVIIAAMLDYSTIWANRLSPR